MVPLQATLVISWFYNEGVGTAGGEIIRHSQISIFVLADPAGYQAPLNSL